MNVNGSSATAQTISQFSKNYVNLLQQNKTNSKEQEVFADYSNPLHQIYGDIDLREEHLTYTNLQEWGEYGRMFMKKAEGREL